MESSVKDNRNQPIIGNNKDDKTSNKFQQDNNPRTGETIRLQHNQDSNQNAPSGSNIISVIKAKIEEKYNTKDTEGETSRGDAVTSKDKDQVIIKEVTERYLTASQVAHLNQDPGESSKDIKKVKHRFAASRYRIKEMWVKAKLKEDEKYLSEENIKLQTNIEELESIKQDCIAELLTSDKNKLYRALENLANLVPACLHSAVLSVKLVMYKKIASEIKELAHLVQSPEKDQGEDQVVPIQEERQAVEVKAEIQYIIKVNTQSASPTISTFSSSSSLSVLVDQKMDGVKEDETSTHARTSTELTYGKQPISDAGKDINSVEKIAPSGGELLATATPHSTFIDLSKLTTPFVITKNSPRADGQSVSVSCGDLAPVEKILHGMGHVLPTTTAKSAACIDMSKLSRAVGGTKTNPGWTCASGQSFSVSGQDYASVETMPHHDGKLLTTAPAQTAPIDLSKPSTAAELIKKSPSQTYVDEQSVSASLLPSVAEQTSPIDLSKSGTGVSVIHNVSQTVINENAASGGAELIHTDFDSTRSPHLSSHKLPSSSAKQMLFIDLSKTSAVRQQSVGDVISDQTGKEIILVEAEQGNMPHEQVPSSDTEMVHTDLNSVRTHGQTYTSEQYTSASTSQPASAEMFRGAGEKPFTPATQMLPIDLSKSSSSGRESSGVKAHLTLPDEGITTSDNNPVIVWVQSISSGIGELPRLDLSNTRTTTEEQSSNLSSPRQQYETSQIQPEPLQARFRPILPDTLHAESRDETLTITIAKKASVDDNISDSDDEPSTSVQGDSLIQQGVNGGKVTLLHKKLIRSRLKDQEPLQGETRKERQRYASAKNRRKNQMIKEALLQDEQQLISANSKLQSAIEELEAIKGSSLAMLATTNKDMTEQVQSHPITRTLQPYWDTVGVKIALRVPGQLNSSTNIAATVRLKDVCADAPLWSEPINREFLDHVLMSVKWDRFEWVGTLVSKGEIGQVMMDYHEEKDMEEESMEEHEDEDIEDEDMEEEEDIKKKPLKIREILHM